MEKIIKTKLTQYAETNNIINDEQAGFRAKKGTNDKLFQLTQIATQAKNRKQACASVFMDVEKAFVKVWHNGLLHTMGQHNIPHIFQRFISSFLSNRHTYFQIENTMEYHKDRHSAQHSSSSMQQISQNHHQLSTSHNSPTTSKHSHPQKTSHNFKPNYKSH